MSEEQKAAREEMVQEAVQRMRGLGLPAERIEGFEREGQLLLAEELPHGRYVLSSGDGRLTALAGKVEEETGALIFAAHLAHAFPFGRTVGSMWTLFSISPDKAQWPQEREAVRGGRIRAFVIAPEQAGAAEIPFRVVNGALIRAEQQ